MALSGLVLVGFACGHMVGNLQMFLHPDWINEYAYKLQHLPYGLLWVFRIVMLILVVAHIATAVLLVATALTLLGTRALWRRSSPA